jgi:hypothetical protein
MIDGERLSANSGPYRYRHSGACPPSPRELGEAQPPTRRKRAHAPREPRPNARNDRAQESRPARAPAGRSSRDDQQGPHRGSRPARLAEACVCALASGESTSNVGSGERSSDVGERSARGVARACASCAPPPCVASVVRDAGAARVADRGGGRGGGLQLTLSVSSLINVAVIDSVKRARDGYRARPGGHGGRRPRGERGDVAPRACVIPTENLCKPYGSVARQRFGNLERVVADRRGARSEREAGRGRDAVQLRAW